MKSTATIETDDARRCFDRRAPGGSQPTREGDTRRLPGRRGGQDDCNHGGKHVINGLFERCDVLA